MVLPRLSSVYGGGVPSYEAVCRKRMGWGICTNKKFALPL